MKEEVSGHTYTPTAHLSLSCCRWINPPWLTVLNISSTSQQETQTCHVHVCVCVCDRGLLHALIILCVQVRVGNTQCVSERVSALNEHVFKTGAEVTALTWQSVSFNGSQHNGISHSSGNYSTRRVFISVPPRPCPLTASPRFSKQICILFLNATNMQWNMSI